MSKCWYCNNELTSGDNPKHFGICSKCYDEMFKSGDTIIRSLTNKIEELQKQVAESENETKHWHDLYKDRDNQFQSIRQRYHLLNRLQAKYDDKDKLHLSEMQCLELVNENEQLKQSQKQLAIEELGRIKEYILINDEYDEEIGCNIIETFDLLEDIRDRIEELKGEE